MSIAGAVFFSVYGSVEAKEIKAVRMEVEIHEGLLRDSQKYLQENESALVGVRTALESLGTNGRK